jgi:phosphate-selective porin OprO and OprP
MALAVLLAPTVPAAAGTAPKQVVTEEVPVEAAPVSLCDQIFGIPTLYRNPENPYIQRFAIRGRYQGQYHHTDANTGTSEDWENRRIRLGADLDFLQDFSFGTRFNMKRQSSDDRLFQDIDTMSITWKIAPEFNLEVGKQKPTITQEYRTSSGRILTFERSLVVNTVIPSKIWGVSASGKVDSFLYDLGVYTASLDGDYDFPDFNGGVAVFASVGYDYGSAAGIDRGQVRLDYFYQDGDGENNGVKPYDHVFSLNTTNQIGRFGLNTDLIYASGEGNTPDIYGVVVMPWYDLIEDRLRLVTRYNYAGGDGSNSVRLGSRYERPAILDGSSDRGDNYHAVYGGFNYYLCGDKLKLMAGVEYATIGGDARYSGVTYLGGVRLDF